MNVLKGQALKEYALYKGEKLLSMGTVKEIATEMGVDENTIRHYKSNVYKKRTSNKNGRRLVLLEDEDD